MCFCFYCSLPDVYISGIGCTFNQLGNAGGFFFGPWLVHLPKNHTHPENFTDYPYFEADSSDTDDLRRSIRDYMWISK